MRTPASSPSSPHRATPLAVHQRTHEALCGLLAGTKASSWMRYWDENIKGRGQEWLDQHGYE